MALRHRQVTVAEDEVELLASGVAGEAGNTRGGLARYPIPVMIQNHPDSVGTLHIGSSDDPDLGTTGLALPPGAVWTGDLIKHIGTQTEKADMVYGEATGGDCDVRVLYTRQNAPTEA